MTDENTTALDLPTCPECELPRGCLDSDDPQPPAPGWLRCLTCFHEWEATPAELGQALAADRAWAQVQAREERMASDGR